MHFSIQFQVATVASVSPLRLVKKLMVTPEGVETRQFALVPQRTHSETMLSTTRKSVVFAVPGRRRKREVFGTGTTDTRTSRRRLYGKFRP
jgi:hypothetical protein